MAEQNKTSQIEDLQSKYNEEYTEQGLFDKIKRYAVKIGYTLLTEALQLYYVTLRPDCPLKVKATIIGALGYLISPLDVIPDFIPGAGFTDDAGAIALAIALAHAYIDDNVKKQAKEKITSIIGKELAEQLEKAAKSDNQKYA